MPRTAAQYEEIRQSRRQEILEAALIVFAESSYHAASVSQIAKKAGISKGLMYNYFNSKEELLQTLMSSIVSQITDILDIDLEVPVDDKMMEGYIDASFEMIKKDPRHMRLYFSLFTQQEVIHLTMKEMVSSMAPFIQRLVEY
ncbi:MAG: TetR/AcrR family transcriptional regulator, partial [Flavobacteriales bacterium]|nr:TetR/AcrR family transcriptional regulator [Flavobacteriales bacterium]